MREEDCEHPVLAFGVIVCSNGALQVRRTCPYCEKIGHQSIAHELVRARGFAIEELPVIRDNSHPPQGSLL